MFCLVFYEMFLNHAHGGAGGNRRSPTALPRASRCLRRRCRGLQELFSKKGINVPLPCAFGDQRTFLKEGSLDSPRTFTREISTFVTPPRGLRATTLLNKIDKQKIKSPPANVGTKLSKRTPPLRTLPPNMFLTELKIIHSHTEKGWSKKLHPFLIAYSILEQVLLL